MFVWVSVIQKFLCLPIKSGGDGDGDGMDWNGVCVFAEGLKALQVGGLHWYGEALGAWAQRPGAAIIVFVYVVDINSSVACGWIDGHTGTLSNQKRLFKPDHEASRTQCHQETGC